LRIAAIRNQQSAIPSLQSATDNLQSSSMMVLSTP
jgi:hypothetical protein